MTDVKAGHRYELTKAGLVEVPGDERPPHFWICRRVADYPPGVIEKLPGAGIAECLECGASIVFNTARKLDAKKACMQCTGMQPSPYPT